MKLFKNYNFNYKDIEKASNVFYNLESCIDSFDFIRLNDLEEDDYFDYKHQYFLYLFFVKNKFFKFTKPIMSRFLDYSGEIHKSDCNYINILLRLSLQSGNKLVILKHFNMFHNYFYNLYSERSNFISEKFSSYDVYLNLSKNNSRFFNINLLLKNILILNESMFNLRVIRFNKSQRKKLKTKRQFFFEVVYLPKYKRYRNILKLIHKYAHHFNNYNYGERLLMAFCDSFFLQKNSFLYKRKIFMYKNAFSKRKK